MKKLCVFPNDPLKSYFKKGEIKPRYFNPKNIFDEVHVISLFDDDIESEFTDFRQSDIRCRHFSIPTLTDGEIKQAFEQMPNLQNIYESGSKDFKDLIRIPFNLWLLERILQKSPEVPDFSKIRSEVQLLGLFWEYHVKGKTNREEIEYILTKATRSMISERTLNTRKEDIYALELQKPWQEVFSSELLVEVPRPCKPGRCRSGQG